MRHVIQFYISKGEKYYTAEGVNLAIVTQSETLDELMRNIKEAVELHLEGENPADFGLEAKPLVMANIELALR